MYQEILFPTVERLTRHNAEIAHRMAINALSMMSVSRYALERAASRYQIRDPRLARTVAGVRFPNPVLLAAGFDKHGEAVEAIDAFGFGGQVTGTVLPRPQLGNPTPRVFRLPEDKAIINRYGFNSIGVDAVIENLVRQENDRDHSIPLGISLGMMKDTPIEEAWKDYLAVLQMIYLFADFLEAGISTPNTQGTRRLQHGELLIELLERLQDESHRLAATLRIRRRPLFVKLAPDLTDPELEEIVPIIVTRADGIVATNTTIQREGLGLKSLLAREAGGLSGKPLAKKSIHVGKKIRQLAGPDYPFISVGGIGSPEDVCDRLQFANLVQLYTALAYQGPQLVPDINRYLLKH